MARSQPSCRAAQSPGRRVPFFITLVCLFATAATAANKAVIIPLPKRPTMEHAITVAPAGGDFSDPAAAIARITDATEHNPYIVVLGPGTYTLRGPLVIPPYVSLVGAGEQGTRLIGAVASDTADDTAALVVMEANSSLNGLTIMNTGGSGYSTGVYGRGSRPRMQDLKVLVSGADDNIGIHNADSSAELRDISITATGGGSCYGIVTISSTASMTDIRADATCGTNNFAVLNIESSPRMSRVIATAAGGNINWAVYNHASFPVLQDVTATAKDGQSYAVYSYNSLVKVRTSTLNGGSYGVASTGGTVSLISRSSLIGGSDADIDSYNICTFADDGAGNVLNGLCP